MVERIAFSAGGSEPLADLEALAAWFDLEPELRGLIEPAAAVPRPRELGAIADALIAAVSSGGAVSVLAASLKTFFAQPRGAKVRLTVTRADGSRWELEADRVAGISASELARLLAGEGVGRIEDVGRIEGTGER